MVKLILFLEFFYLISEPLGARPYRAFHAVMTVHRNQTKLGPPAVKPFEVVQ